MADIFPRRPARVSRSADGPDALRRLGARSGEAFGADRVGEGASVRAAATEEPVALSLVELMFFAYRDFTGEADAVLQAFGFGRAHHRVLHFVDQRPGLRVADLLDILRITKQSLARVLKELVDRGFIVQAAGDTDKRERRLHVTAEGAALAAQLAGLQMRRVEDAVRRAALAVDGLLEDGHGTARLQVQAIVGAFLGAMIEPQQNGLVDRQGERQNDNSRDDTSQTYTAQNFKSQNFKSENFKSGPAGGAVQRGKGRS